MNKAPVYDILNCGPRNQFMANNLIISNSSGDKANFQNLGRSGKLSFLREAIVAPPGHVIVAGDLSQIEARVLDMVAGAGESIANYRAKKDPYIPFAAKYYDKPESEVTKEERGFGKRLRLAAGYQMGGPKFKALARNFGVEISEDEARYAIQKFRYLNPQIKDLWDACRDMIPRMAGAEGELVNSVPHHSGMFSFAENSIECVTGFTIKYPKLAQFQGERRLSWTYFDAKTKSRVNIYGGKIVENIVQHLAGRVVADHLVRLNQISGRRAAFMVHDELVYVVPAEDAAEFIQEMKAVMSTPPRWWPDLPVDCEVGVGVNYKEAK